MHIIYLAGNSFGNKSWIEKIKTEFDKFSDGEILYYDHWQSGEKWINLQKESEKLTEFAKDKTDYFVFAKSIGSVLALKNIFEKTLNPQKLIICGHPYPIAKQENLPIDEYLKTLTVPTVFIQNESDPVYSFDELSKTLKDNRPSNYHHIKNPDNNTHDYEDINGIIEIAKLYFENKSNLMHNE